MDCVHIERIAGPEVVRAGSDLMLDCNFSYLAEEESQLGYSKFDGMFLD